MAPEFIKWRWCVAFAMFCMFATAASTTSVAQQTVAPQRQETSTAQRVVHPAGSHATVQDKLPVEVVPQIGHTGTVKSVAFSRDGRFVLSGSDDGTLKLWDASTGVLLRSFIGHSNHVNSVAISSDFRFALSGSQDHTLKLWEVASGKEVRSFAGHSDGINSVAFSPDGHLALSGGQDRALKLWETASGKLLRTFGILIGDVDTVAFSPDGRLAVSGGGTTREDTLIVWDVASGKQLRSIAGHSEGVLSAAFSPDGRSLIAGSYDGTLKLWDVVTGAELRNFKKRITAASTSFAEHALGVPADTVMAVAFSPDGRFIISGGGEDDLLRLWNVATGEEVRSFSGHSGGIISIAFSPDGRFAASGATDNTIKLWEISTGQELRSLIGHANEVKWAGFSPDGHFASSGDWRKTLQLWELATGRALHSISGYRKWGHAVVFSADGRFALSGSLVGDGVVLSADGRPLRSTPSGMTLWELSKGQRLRDFSSHTGAVWSVALSRDGRLALSGSDGGYALTLWEVATGKELRTFRGHRHVVSSLAFSPDGAFALSGSWDTTLKLWDLAAGKELRTFNGHLSQVKSVAFSPDGRLALSGSSDHSVRLWDVATGKELRSILGHAGSVTAVAFSPDGRNALSGSDDGTTRLWDIKSGREIARMMATPDGAWLTLTPKGFFSASRRDFDLLAIVRGLEVATVGQVHQSLFNPDLVREALAGDPDGEVKRAAEVVNLEKVLNAGPPPVAAIMSHTPGSRSSADLVTVAARITDRGKGIGRIEWRINGVTAGVMAAPAGPGPDYDVKQELALDPGENRIEVIAYEGRNLLASPAARTTITYDGPADSVKPKLFVLAVGINDYVDTGWEPPGSDQIWKFPPLNSSVPDAQAFSAKMKEAGAGQYTQVRVTLALDADATAAKLEETVRKLAGEISPRDTFVFYAAAHGYSVGGNYFMIPQDYQGGPNPAALNVRAIGQDRLQDWIANRIKAKKALILLDTCESGALTGGYTKSRTEGPATEAAIGRLHEATGRPVLTAASGGKSAYEGYKGHGVFTYALMEALREGDTNNNGKIEVTELAAHVEKRVPELFAELKQSGWVVKGAAPAARGSGDDKQSAHFGSTGEDFALAARLP